MIRHSLLFACLAALPGVEFDLPGFDKQVIRDTPEHRIVQYTGMFTVDGHRFRSEIYLDRINGAWSLQQSLSLLRGGEPQAVLSQSYDCRKEAQMALSVSAGGGLSVNYTAPGFALPGGEERGETFELHGFDGDTPIDVSLRRNQHGVLLPAPR